jgi:hypothetical protein
LKPDRKDRKDRNLLLDPPVDIHLLVDSISSCSPCDMAPKTCGLCQKARAILKRPKTGQQICKECFFYVFETEVHNTIKEAMLFRRGDRIAIGASGGKGTLVMFEACGDIS